MYDQKPQLPVDLHISTQNADMSTTTSTKFVQQLCERISRTYKTTQQVIERENRKYKLNYSHKVKCTQFFYGWNGSSQKNSFSR